MLIQRSKKLDNLSCALATLIPIVGLFSPLLGIIIGITFFIFMSAFIQKENRYFSSLCIVILMAVMFASRNYAATYSDDFYYYYNSYNDQKGNFNQIFEFGGGFEIGLGLILYLAYNTLPQLTPQGLIFFITTLELIIYVFVLEVFVLKKINPRLRSISLSIFLTMSLGLLAGQISRQYGAIPLLAAAMLSESKKDKFTLLLLSSLFHASSIFIYPLIYLFTWGSKSWKRFLLASILVYISLFLFENYGNLLNVFGYLDQKLIYSESDLNGSVLLRNYRVLIIFSVLLMILSSAINGDSLGASALQNGIRFCFIALFFSFTYSAYSSFAYRSLLPVVVFFIWHNVVKIISSKVAWSGVLVSLILLFFTARSWMPTSHDVAMSLWKQYPTMSTNPGYYIYYIFQ